MTKSNKKTLQSLGNLVIIHEYSTGSVNLGHYFQKVTETNLNVPLVTSSTSDSNNSTYQVKIEMNQKTYWSRISVKDNINKKIKFLLDSSKF